MYKVGFNGGGTLIEVCDVSVMEAFFLLIRDHATTLSEAELALVGDRLYRRYVRLEDAEATRLVLASIRQSFSELPVAMLDGRLPDKDRVENPLSNTDGTLAGAFSKHFDAIERCLESAEVNLRHFSGKPEFDYKYEPVVVIRSEMPGFMLDKRISLSAYDGLDGPPFWLRHKVSGKA